MHHQSSGTHLSHQELISHQCTVHSTAGTGTVSCQEPGTREPCLLRRTCSSCTSVLDSIGIIIIRMFIHCHCHSISAVMSTLTLPSSGSNLSKCTAKCSGGHRGGVQRGRRHPKSHRAGHGQSSPSHSMSHSKPNSVSSPARPSASRQCSSGALSGWAQPPAAQTTRNSSAAPSPSPCSREHVPTTAPV